MQIFNWRGTVVGLTMGILAVATPVRSQTAPVSPATGNFVLRRVVSDRVLRQSWAVLQDRDHPERPPKMVQLAERSQPIPISPVVTVHVVGNTAPPPPLAIPALANAPQSSAASPMLVRAGDRVHLWSVTANVRLEIEAIALDYGHAGQIVHARRLDRDANRRAPLTAVVIGENSAELLP